MGRANPFRMNLPSAMSFEPNKGIHIGKRPLGGVSGSVRQLFLAPTVKMPFVAFREIESDRS
jgi:hypothetical protein